MPYVDLSATRKTRSILPNRRSGVKSCLLISVVAVAVIGGLFFVLTKFVKTADLVGAPVTVYSTFAKPKPLNQTNGFTNVLLLGVDTRPKEGAFQSGTLTDTILVASFSQVASRVVLTSIPRDLYVKETGTKINSIYSNSGYDVTATKRVVEEVLGISIHYYALVDFQGFTKAIDAVGGVTVDVPEAFVDYNYPIEGREESTCGMSSEAADQAVGEALAVGEDPQYRFLCRFEVLKFAQGSIHLDGATALKFARSRHADGVMGSDFGRALRQQLVMNAVKDKILSAGTIFNIGKLQELYQTIADSVTTDIAVADLPEFFNVAKKLKDIKPQNIVLSTSGAYGDGSLLVGDTIDGVGWVARPRTGDYSEIKNLLNQKMFLPLEASTSAKLP